MISQAIVNSEMLCPEHLREETTEISGITEEIHLKYIAEAVDYINDNYDQDLTLDVITRKAFLSKFHFSRLFKKYTSYSPYQYLINVRLYHSRQLLLNDKYTVKEVAGKCGFKRLDYFSSAFKKKFKCNPTTYREHYKAVA